MTIDDLTSSAIATPNDHPPGGRRMTMRWVFSHGDRLLRGYDGGRLVVVAVRIRDGVYRQVDRWW